MPVGYNMLHSDLRNGRSIDQCRIGSYADLISLYGCAWNGDLLSRLQSEYSVHCDPILDHNRMVIGVTVSHGTKQSTIYFDCTVAAWKDALRSIVQ